MKKNINYFKTYEIEDLKDMLEKTSNQNGKKTAFKLKDNNGKIIKKTYIEFKNDVESLATKLIDLGLKNERIAVMGKNSYKWAISYLASTIIGVVVPIDKEASKENIKDFLNTSNSKAIIADDKYLNEIFEFKDGLKNETLLIDMQNTSKYMNIADLIKEGQELILDGNEEYKNITINPDEMKILLFTSGTTGNSKAVMLSHKNICSNIVSIASIVKVDNLTSVLSILPLHHTYECTIGYLLVIYGGGKISYCEGLRYITKNIQEFKPTFILCVPLLLEKMYQKHL